MTKIQWFPGHMAQATKIISENLRRVDLVIEILDARAPRASRNPLLREIIHNKKKITLFNKNDLADPKASLLWKQKFFEEEQDLPLFISASSRSSLEKVLKRTYHLCREASWLSRRPIRALITGIPNVGKSTIIKTLAPQNSVITGAQPGLTRQLRRIPINKRVEFFDTPGLLWHKFEDQTSAIKLAALGAIKETILPDEELSAKVLRYLAQEYPLALEKRYGLAPPFADTSDLVGEIGRKRGCLLRNGKIDFARTCQMLLKDLREGRLGLLSLEWPKEKGWD